MTDPTIGIIPKLYTDLVVLRDNNQYIDDSLQSLNDWKTNSGTTYTTGVSDLLTMATDSESGLPAFTRCDFLKGYYDIFFKSLCRSAVPFSF